MAMYPQNVPLAHLCQLVSAALTPESTKSLIERPPTVKIMRKFASEKANVFKAQHSDVKSKLPAMA